MFYPDECKIDRPIIFDTHSHYDDEKFDECRNVLLDELFKNGICGIITCGCDKASSLKALETAKNHCGIYAAVGIHPENLESNTTIDDIRQLIANEKCVAIGEIGLDYHWSDDRETQKKVFEEQLILANELNLPVIVHDRDAHADTLELLLKYKPRGVVHCFSGSAEMAKDILKIGMYIGVGGVATFKNAKKMPEVIESLPDDRILLETDCPYLAPEPYRGKICHSGFIPLTAQRVAEIRGVDRDTVLLQTLTNAKKLFGL